MRKPSPTGRLSDFLTILASGRFEHARYARVHLHTPLAAPFALLHYVLVGEAEGRRPCPFFDPAHRRRVLGAAAPAGNLFAAFLRAEDRLPTCVEFDADWYAASDPSVAASGMTPWQHLHRRGLAALKDPSPHVSIPFLLRAYHKKPRNLVRSLMEIFERRRGPNGGAFVLDDAGLMTNQARFRAAIRMEQRRGPPQRRRRDLVFVQTAGRHGTALEGGNYDLLLNYYADPEATPPRAAEWVFVQRGSKATAIDKLRNERPEVLAGYDYVLFLDDDVEIDAAAIEQLFEIMRREGLDCAQPALSAQSVTRFPELVVRPDGPAVRRTTAVEIMMPALSRRALVECGWAFGGSISGYGVDILLGHEVRRRFGETVAVINEVTGQHLRAPDTDGSAFYRFLAANDIDPFVELWALLGRYGLDSTMEAIEGDHARPCPIPIEGALPPGT